MQRMRTATTQHPRRDRKAAIVCGALHGRSACRSVSPREMLRKFQYRTSWRRGANAWRGTGCSHRKETTMTERTREILSWYRSDTPGTLTNIARLLNHGRLGGTGRLVILPVDQGFEHGPARSFAPNPAAYDPRYHFELALSAGCNAYAAPLGFLEAGAAEYAGEIPLILKLNNSDSLYSGTDPAPAITGSA